MVGAGEKATSPVPIFVLLYFVGQASLARVGHATGRRLARAYILNSAGSTYSQGSPARYFPAISSTFTAY